MGQEKKGLAALAASLIATVFVLMLGGVHAEAADKNKPSSVKADDYLPPVTATAAKPWSGCRLYGDLGYLTQTDRTVDNTGAIQFDVSTAVDGVTYGFGTGCDIQAGEKWVFGGFADISWTNKGQQFSIPTPAGGIVGDTEINHMITVGGRLGYLFTPKWMGYALAGYTWVDSNTVSSFGWGNSDPETTDALGKRGGWTAGLGSEAFISERWTLSLEYRYTRLDGGTLQWAEVPSAVADVDTDLHRFIAQLGYHF